MTTLREWILRREPSQCLRAALNPAIQRAVLRQLLCRSQGPGRRHDRSESMAPLSRRRRREKAGTGVGCGSDFRAGIQPAKELMTSSQELMTSSEELQEQPEEEYRAHRENGFGALFERWGRGGHDGGIKDNVKGSKDALRGGAEDDMRQAEDAMR